ncbi:MAG: hypothetical protein ACE5KV_04140 [Thermoplasmata archaeon]
MRADTLVVIGAIASLILLGLLGLIVTEADTKMELIPGGDPDNPQDYVPVQIEVRPFQKMGLSSIIFGVAVLIIFLAVAGARRIRGS